MVTSDTGELSTPKFVNHQGKKFSLDDLERSKRYTAPLSSIESPENKRRLQVERALDNDRALQQKLETDFAQNGKITIAINLPFTGPLKLEHPELKLTREEIVQYVSAWKPVAQMNKSAAIV